MDSSIFNTACISIEKIYCSDRFVSILIGFIDEVLNDDSSLVNTFFTTQTNFSYSNLR